MKAKYFTKLKAKAQYYEVARTHRLFGSFSRGCTKRIVLANNYEDAVQRFIKRTNIKERCSCSETSYEWARFMITPINTPYERFIKYYW